MLLSWNEQRPTYVIVDHNFIGIHVLIGKIFIIRRMMDNPYNFWTHFDLKCFKDRT